jgi:hypothetical protein
MGGLAPPGVRPCWAHMNGTQLSAILV